MNPGTPQPRGQQRQLEKPLIEDKEYPQYRGECSTDVFLRMLFQSVFGLTFYAVVLAVVVGIGLIGTPYYQIWYAEKGVKVAELDGMAELARASQIAQIDVEMAQTRRVALGIQATGFKSAATQQADAIRLVADALRRYPDDINDEYLNLMFKQLPYKNVTEDNK